MIVGVSYHYIRPSYDQPYPGIFGVTPDELRQQLERLGGLGDFVSLDQIRNALQNDAALPERGWLITFDDGLREQYDHAIPILESLGVPAVFFANTRPIAEQQPVLVHMTHLLRTQVAPSDLMAAVQSSCIELAIPIPIADSTAASRQYVYDDPEVAQIKFLLNFALPESARQQVVDYCFDNLLAWSRPEVCADLYMNRTHLHDLAQRGWLGSHTHSHRSMGSLTVQEAERDIQLSISLLEDWTGVRVDSIAYPYGSLAACPAWLGKVGARVGLRMGFTMERGGISKFTHPLLLPRCAPNDLPGGNAQRWTDKQVFDSMPSSVWYAALSN